VKRFRGPGIALVVVIAATWIAVSVYGPREVRINVRWAPEVTEAVRQDREARFQLARGELAEGTTWTYWLQDPSRAIIRALVLDEAVGDTAHLHRTAFRPELAQYHAFWAWMYALAAGMAAAVVTWLLSLIRWTSAPRAYVEPASRPRLWTWAVVAVAAPMAITLAAVLWTTPFPISETVGILEDVVRIDDVSRHFDPALRSWYRPLYWVTWEGLMSQGSVTGALTLFRGLEVGLVLVLFLLFVRCVRPATMTEAAAALCAVAVLMGSPGFRDNLELPLLNTLVAMPLVVVTWKLLESSYRWWHGPVVIGLVLVAVGFKEQGLVLVPVVLAAWWIGAPGGHRRTALVLAAATVAYLVMRLATSGTWNRFEQDIAIGFTQIPGAEANVRFSESFLWVYAYNVLSTVSNILFSEPSRGRFGIVERIVSGSVAPWALIQLLTSVATTVLIGRWGARVVRRDRQGGWTSESRLLVVTVVAVAASGALGFNYSRDRLGGMAVVFYALAAFHALRMVLVDTTRLAGRARVAAAIALALLAGGWQLRAMGTIQQAQVMSATSRLEWMVRPPDLRAEFADRPVYLELLEELTPQGVASSAATPTEYPGLLVALIGER
jgi:hypothetical protein